MAGMVILRSTETSPERQRGGKAPSLALGAGRRWLCQYRLDRRAVLGRQRDRPQADVVVLLRVDADRLEDRRRHVAGTDLALRDRVAVGVTLAVDRAALDAAAGE